MKFWTRAFLYRLGGNAGLTFIAPFMGTQIILGAAIIDSILVSLFSTIIVTAAVFFRRMEKVGKVDSSRDKGGTT